MLSSRPATTRRIAGLAILVALLAVFLAADSLGRGAGGDGVGAAWPAVATPEQPGGGDAFPLTQQPRPYAIGLGADWRLSSLIAPPGLITTTIMRVANTGLLPVTVGLASTVRDSHGWYDLSAMPLVVSLAPGMEIAWPVTLTVPLGEDGPREDTVVITAIAAEAPRSGYERRFHVHISPLASWHAYPSAGLAPLTVTFSDRSEGAIESWSWDFGDGSTSRWPTPQHTFTRAGDYQVVLTVSGPHGSESYSEVITVR